jgi:hypothetical protein
MSVWISGNKTEQAVVLLLIVNSAMKTAELVTEMRVTKRTIGRAMVSLQMECH